MSAIKKLLGFGKKEENKVVLPSEDEVNTTEYDYEDESKDEVKEESDSDSEESIEDSIGKKLSETETMSMYQVSAAHLCKICRRWTHNRKLRESHVKKIYQGIEASKFLIGTFTGVQDSQGKITLIDGHHRLEALRKLAKESPETILQFQDVYLQLFQVDEVDSHGTYNIFDACNTTRALEAKDMPELKVINVMKQMKDNFPKVFTKTNAKRPRVNEKLFADKIKAVTNRFPKVSAQDIYDTIMETNNELKEQKVKFFTGEISDSKKKDAKEKMRKLLAKADSINCRLFVRENRSLAWIEDVCSKLKKKK